MSHPQNETTGRVLPFKPRAAQPDAGAPPSPVADLQKYESQDADGDYRHRMIVNGLAAFVTTILIVGGIWIANTMVQLRKDEECMLSGRRGCTPIDLASHQ